MPGSHAKALYASDGLVLQNTHYYATILLLSFGRLVFADLVALPHCAWCQHSGKGNVGLLKQDLGYIIGAVLAELLVQFHAANGRGVAFHFDHVAVDSLAFPSQGQKLGRILGINFDFAVPEIKMLNFSGSSSCIS